MLSLWLRKFSQNISKVNCTVPLLGTSKQNLTKSGQKVINIQQDLSNCVGIKISRMSNSASQDGSLAGLPLQHIVDQLGKIVPLNFAASWDNVGLLLEPSSSLTVRKVLLTNDLTEPVLDEAIDQGVNLIISYHPPIFRPFKTLRPGNWKEKIVLRCAEERIAIYSPHTGLDAIKGGVNDWLLDCVSVDEVRPIQQSLQSLNATDDSDSLIGYGMGRVGKLVQPLSLEALVEVYKNHLQLPHLRVALAINHTMSSKINTIAVCAGSGATVLSGVKADLWVTGEMSHHEVLDANYQGSSVILSDHSNSERGFLVKFQEKVQTTLGPNLRIFISKKDRDPLTVV